MAVNKYGNDFRNNIMWNKDYPWIPEVTNDNGITFHEGDDVIIPNSKYEFVKIVKIFDKDYVITYIKFPRCKEYSHFIVSSNRLVHTKPNPNFKLLDYDAIKHTTNSFQFWLDHIYFDKYGEEFFDDEENYWKVRKADVVRAKVIIKKLQH